MFLYLLKWRCYNWLPGYYLNRFYYKKRKFPESVHIIVLVVDHFEPSHIDKKGVLGTTKVRRWCEKYEDIARLHCDTDGVSPQHTWFYRYDYPNYKCLSILSEYVYKELGEIEFHLHHGYDTAESFTKKICEGVAWFNQVGAMISAESSPQTRFAYIAGDWALDNGRRDPAFSGVNNELMILNKAGCYADFTFPAIGTKAHPRKVNSIYYATDTPTPKSYTTGIDVRVGGKPSGDLMIFQGPLYVDWGKRHIETPAFESFARYRPYRIDNWISSAIHVIGRPDWIFIKLHTHGMQSKHVFLSEELNNMLSDLERRFKKPPFHLHYVTAREAYNIVKAAEAGKDGDPNSYRDFAIPKWANRKIFCNQPYKLEKYSKDNVIVKIKSSSSDTVIMFKDLPLKSIKGQEIKRVEITYSTDSIERLQVEGNGRCVVSYKEAQDGKLINTMRTFNAPFCASERFKKLASAHP